MEVSEVLALEVTHSFHHILLVRASYTNRATEIQEEEKLRVAKSEYQRTQQMGGTVANLVNNLHCIYIWQGLISHVVKCK